MRALVLVIVVAGAWSQTPPSRHASLMLPPVALEAADQGPLALAFVLAPFGLPAGVITAADPSRLPFGELAARLTEPRTVPANDVIERFIRDQPNSHVTWQGEVLRIEDRDLGCGREVRRRTVGPVEVEGDMSRLVVLLGWLAGGRNGPIPGGTMGPAVPTRVEAAPLPTIRIASAQALSLSEGLDELVRQSLGGVWVVWQHQRPDGRIGCRAAAYFPNGYVGASLEDFAVLTSPRERLEPSDVRQVGRNQVTLTGFPSMFALPIESTSKTVPSTNRDFSVRWTRQIDNTRASQSRTSRPTRRSVAQSPKRPV